MTPMAAHVARVVSQAPALTPAQRDVLGAVLAVVRAAGTSSPIGRTRHRTVQISTGVLDAMIEANTRPAIEAS